MCGEGWRGSLWIFWMKSRLKVVICLKNAKKVDFLWNGRRLPDPSDPIWANRSALSSVESLTVLKLRIQSTKFAGKSIFWRLEAKFPHSKSFPASPQLARKILFFRRLLECWPKHFALFASHFRSPIWSYCLNRGLNGHLTDTLLRTYRLHKSKSTNKSSPVDNRKSIRLFVLPTPQAVLRRFVASHFYL